VKSGGALPDTDVGNAPETGKGGMSYMRLEPNWNADCTVEGSMHT
jgi:hypothetical protein